MCELRSSLRDPVVVWVDFVNGGGVVDGNRNL